MIVMPSMRLAGAETQSIDLANGLAKKGHRVHVFTFMPDKAQLNRLSANVQHHFFERSSKFSYRYIARLAALLDQERIDVIHSVMQFSGLVSWIAARLSKKKPSIVVAVHTTTNYDLSSELADRFLYLWILQRVSAVVFVCKYQRDHWVEKYPSLGGRSVTVYNGIDTRYFDPMEFLDAGRELRECLGISSDTFVFSCIAGFRPEKGHDILIDAFTKLPERSVLLLVGDGPLRASIEQAIIAAGVAERVKILGVLADVRPVIAASNATVLASTAVETFSMAMLESLSMATPMIAPRIGGLAEAIGDGKTGMLFPVGSSSALSECMQWLMSNPEAAREMGISGREKVRREFDLTKMLDESDEVLEEAVEQIQA